jgi:hypothetical protein
VSRVGVRLFAYKEQQAQAVSKQAQAVSKVVGVGSRRTAFCLKVAGAACAKFSMQVQAAGAACSQAEVLAHPKRRS